ncbi:MAG: acyltransferase domain-containing protein [Desulfobacterales bacterium]|nr:acyltransferase domain-containing protein [Desulfobacterales bacterium]
MKKDDKNIPIAIIGMECLFPKSAGLKEYFRLILNAEDAITQIPKTHWSVEDYYDKNPKKPDYTYCKRGGFLSPISFDPSEFGIPPNALEATDTSQLLSLFVAKNALQKAGYWEEKPFNKGKVSVLLGITGTQELVIPLGARLGHPLWRKALESAGASKELTEEVVQRISDSYVSWQENSFPGLLGNVVAGRICNRFDFGGTNCVVDAACASSLGALYLGIMELTTGRSDMVLTGGADTLNDIFMHMCFSKTPVLSHSGDVKPFSEEADGTVLGEGIGILILKRLEDAEKDGDKIYAVIKGIGSSSDGKAGSIYAPQSKGQEKALRIAYEQAGYHPSTIEIVEAHGTGTRVGDAVEFSALAKVFAEGNTKNKCALGSVKSMIGHTKAAAGSAGLIKLVLSLHHKILFPTIKVEKPDPKLKIEESPFYLNTQSRPWFLNNSHPRRGSVSSFGFGGSNFHMTLEEYEPYKKTPSWDGSVQIIALSGNTKNEVFNNLINLKSDIEKNLNPDELLFKIFKAKENFSSSNNCRLLIAVQTKDGIIEALSKAIKIFQTNSQNDNWEKDGIYYGTGSPSLNIAFVFPGQGSQYVNMGRDIVCWFPDCHKIFEKSDYYLKKYRQDSESLSDYIYPNSIKLKDLKTTEELLRNTDVAQPSIGFISACMLKALEWFGVKPHAVCGHSFGELTALYSAGWLKDDDFFALATLRGKFMASAGQASGIKGCMLAVKAPLDVISQIITDNNIDVILANKNTPEQGVLSGSCDDITIAESVFKEKGYKTIQLPVASAFHSKLVKDAAEPFSQALKDISLVPSSIPVSANTTGNYYPSNSDEAKILLGNQLINPVEFVSQIESLYNSGINTFIEIGPKSVLTGLVSAILKNKNVTAISLDSSNGKKSGIFDFAKVLCHLASLGYPIDLIKWEEPVNTPKKQKMSIPLCGANYRDTSKPKRNYKTDFKKIEPKNIEVKDEKKSSVENISTSNSAIMVKDKLSSHQTIKPIIKKSESMDTNKGMNKNLVIDALKVVQEGLKSMQELQRQTAETHQKFLESQTEASKTLQSMMENTQRLAGAALGLAKYSSDELIKPSVRESFEPVSRQIKEEKVVKAQPPQTESKKVEYKSQYVEKPISSEKIETPKIEENHSKETSKKETTVSAQKEVTYDVVEKTMLKVVSELTGYPVEMLGMDMEIEADLGIDSIKRVEILSTMEEKMPELGGVSPDVMGKMKTLREIADYLRGNLQKSSQDKPSPTLEEANADNETIDSLKIEIEKNILEVVSQLTGYPVEMLGMDMEIEADLGIDSIKRVEILSTFEERMPDLPSISPEVLGNLKTLRQISEYLVDSIQEKNQSEKTPSLGDKKKTL